MKKPAKIISDWLFSTLAGVFVEGSTLYVPKGSVSEGVLASGNIDVKDSRIVGYSITAGRVYPLATKEDVKTPYVTYDSITVNYDATKDGCFPSSLTFRVLCVEKTYTAVDALADAVEDALNNAYVDELDSELIITTRASEYDAGVGEFVEELKFSITL